MAHGNVLRQGAMGVHRLEPRISVAGLAPYTHGLLRIGTGLLFFQHGLQKLFGMLGGFGEPGGRAALNSQMGIAGLLEFVGGALLVLGLFTRPVAFVLAGEMVVAYVIAHMPHGGWPIQNHGELALLYAFVFLWLSTHGSGPMSLDRRVSRGRNG